MGKNLKKKILYISGTRADYGLMRETLFLIKKNPSLELEIIATGMHVMPEFGQTIDEVKKDGFKVNEVDLIFKKDSKESMAIFIGKFIQLLTEKIVKLRPDIILLLGDRPEMLAAAIVGSYATIPVAHIHGGDVTSTVDDVVRNAITKLSHIHLSATKKSAERIKKMGEEKWRINVVGAPGLDGVLSHQLVSSENIAKKYTIDPRKPILLVAQHSVTMEMKDAKKQIIHTMEAIRELKLQTIVIYPNADAGGREIIKVIKKYKNYPFVRIYKNINRADYLSLLKVVDVMIGNSSSGIIEAPSFFLPVVNIGTRQLGRERVHNTIEVGYKKEKIKKAIKKALYDNYFKNKVARVKNPYGSGKAGEKITKILANIRIDEKLLNKRITY